MPLNRPALSLGTGPRGAADARRWVADTCRDLGRDDVVESAELGVSELVTNALLHAEGPISVRVRGTAAHPRIEVRDGSTQPPDPPAPIDLDDDPEAALLTFGRGLSIVARAATAWGADIDATGKVVWFEPAAELAEDDGPACQITRRTEEQRSAPGGPRIDVRLLAVPIRAFTGFERHYRELRREVRLLAVAHETSYPLAKTLSDFFGALDAPMREVTARAVVERAAAEGREVGDLRLQLDAAEAGRLGRLMELLDLADAFCREERMLSLARSPYQRRFQGWVLTEIGRQARGAQPQPWQEPDAADEHGRARRTSVS